MAKPNVRKPAPAEQPAAAPAPAKPEAPAKAETSPEPKTAKPMSDAEALHGAIQLLNYAADAGAFANNPKLWGPKAQVLDRLAAMAVKAQPKG